MTTLGFPDTAAPGTKPSHRVKVVVREKEKKARCYGVAPRRLEVEQVGDLAKSRAACTRFLRAAK